MSVKNNINSNSRNKKRKFKQTSVHNVLNESEVIISNNSSETSNKPYFADITRKNSSGSNNWTKFSQSLGRQSTKQSVNNKSQVQTSSSSFGQYGEKKSFTSSDNIKPRTVRALKQCNFKTPDGPISLSVTEDVKEVSVPCTTNTSSKTTLTKHIAMDCEMVGVDIGVNKNMLARISLVNSHGDCIYDKFVKPTEPVLDYRTRVSGVRPKDLENATDFKIVQREVADILKGRVLVGHALKNDLKVLYLSHPKHSIRDTSRFQKFREGKTPALKKLAKKYLGATIQEGEHSSVQDALATMQLYKMFKKEWETSIYSKKHQDKKVKKSTS